VHLSHKAVDPPGEARSDFEIFVDYSKGWISRTKMGILSFHGLNRRKLSMLGKSSPKADLAITVR
jgi:hypothetical protein